MVESCHLHSLYLGRGGGIKSGFLVWFLAIPDLDSVLLQYLFTKDGGILEFLYPAPKRLMLKWTEFGDLGSFGCKTPKECNF